MGIAAVEIVEKDTERRENLRTNSALLRAGLGESGYFPGKSQSQIMPLIVGDASRCMMLSQRLLERGVFAQGIRPPTVPPGTSRLRLTVMATHTRRQLEEALRIYKEVQSVI
jgi:8-amino-7-oxononanoate synthase